MNQSAAAAAAATASGLSLWMGCQGGQPPSKTQHESLHHQIPSSRLISYSDDVPPPLITCSNPTAPNQNYHLSQLLSIPSLYSTEQHIPPRALNTSATALLQKAAQIGATTSTTAALSSPLQGGAIEYARPISTLTGLGSDKSLLDSSSHGICTLATSPPFYPPAKRRNTQSEDGAGGGQTRDFLGVGVRTICNPPSINGWI
ncbi:hypothetical protein SAY86_023745 [Trapa natans]|uniref:Uncharacterized protein n=1 Tax=Trapa natans TaxID=22666 RepID=A0AAN7R9L5_TRANT|nr:hypothetical protein SAY86_023745 [Trapa natans]